MLNFNPIPLENIYLSRVGGGPTTAAIGEDGGDGNYTTEAVGEEGGGGSTLALGEEGGGGGNTTQAVGEEGGGGGFTTLANGEEGGGYHCRTIQPPKRKWPRFCLPFLSKPWGGFKNRCHQTWQHCCNWWGRGW